MSEQKKPQAGEWWFSGDMKHRMLCHGEAQQGRVIMEDHTGEVDAYERLNKSWHHEPRCTGWDWHPEPDPEWFDLTPFDGHMLRTPVDHVSKGGRFAEVDGLSGATVGFAKRQGFTQFRCLLKDAPPELVTKANKPAEDPDEWVTQDRVPYRRGVDEFRWERLNGTFTGPWSNLETNPRMHGYIDGLNDRFQVRCRRRDLPPMPEQPKTETVTFYEVMIQCDISKPRYELAWTSVIPSQPNWIPTGRTETREVSRG